MHLDGSDRGLSCEGNDLHQVLYLTLSRQTRSFDGSSISFHLISLPLTFPPSQLSSSLALSSFPKQRDPRPQAPHALTVGVRWPVRRNALNRLLSSSVDPVGFGVPAVAFW